MTAPRFPLAALLLATLLPVLAAPEARRDPLRAPAPPAAPLAPAANGTAGAPAASPGAAPADAAPVFQPRQIIEVGGCRYVVERGRRYGPGDSIGGLRIESIDDSGVTLHDGQRTQRVALFGAVAKRAPAAGLDPAGAALPVKPVLPATRPVAGPAPSRAVAATKACTAASHPG